MDEKDEAIFLALARRDRAVRKLAKIQEGRAPASADRALHLEAEIARLGDEITRELEGGNDA